SVALLGLAAGEDERRADDLALRVAIGDPEAARADVLVDLARLAGLGAGDAREAEQEVLVIEIVAVDPRGAGRVPEVEILEPEIERVEQLVRPVDEIRVPGAR